jgi:hypothetical protein
MQASNAPVTENSDSRNSHRRGQEQRRELSPGDKNRADQAGSGE